jgi:hypothetical protein
MPKFKYKDKGVPFEIEAESQDAADAWLMEQHASGKWAENKPTVTPPSQPQGYQTDAQGIPIDPRSFNFPKTLDVKERLKNKTFSEQVQGGLGHAFNQGALGIKGLMTNLSPDDERRLGQGQEFVENTGAGSSLGQGLGQVAMLGNPAAGVANAVGQTLTKSVPLAAKLAAKGKGAFNAGAAGNLALQGGIQGGVLAPEEGEHRAQNAAEGGALGALLPGAAKIAMMPVNAIGRGIRGAWNAVSPTVEGAARDAYKMFEKNLGGREGVDAVVRNVRGASTPMLPKSTAALAGTPQAEAMEYGARRRGNVDWPAHDDSVGYLAWRELEHSPDGLPPSEGMEALLHKYKPNGIPQGELAGRTLEPELQEPFVSSADLRAVLGKVSNGMRKTEIDHVRRIASELGQYEGAKFDPSSVKVDMGDAKKGMVSAAMALASAGVDSTKMWKTRAAYNAVSNTKLRDKTVDEALHDPQKFVALAEKIQAKLAARKEITPGEAAFQQAILAGNREAMSPKGNK